MKSKFCLLLFSILTTTTAFAEINIPLQVKETQGYARTLEMVHNGLPLAKADNVTATSSLVISDGSSSIPATFEVLARWGGGKDDATKPIKWVLTSFPASVSADSTATYYLRDYGTPATITNPINVTDGTSSITVDTGPAEFVISETAMTLFDSITINGNALASGNGGSYSTIDSQSAAAANAPTVTIERQNDHYVCIKSVGTYANTPYGAANAQPMHYRIRYEFFAGSPTAIITHKFFWPGYDSAPLTSNHSHLDIGNVSLKLPDVSGYSSTDVYATSSINYTGVTGETATVTQELRTTFTDAHQSTVSHGATSQTTTFATMPAIVNSATNGKLVATIGNMKFFEPQSISSDSSGKITINDVSEAIYFAEDMGAWAKIGVGAISSSSSFSDIASQVIAPVDHRLMAIEDTDYFVTTNVFNRIPNPSSTTTEIVAWWTEIGEVAAKTVTWLPDEGFQGIMTWGALPRYYSETGSGTGWDKIYAGGVLTDYHSSWLTMTTYGLLSGDVDKITEFAFNGARRMLHTQIYQPDNYDSSRSSQFMGWAPSGYNLYRSDGNSSHSYFDNLYAYYFLTGDMEVIDILTVGGETKRGWYTRDSSGDLDDPTTRPAAWVDYSDRVFGQAAGMFDFLGHASDSSFLDDWEHGFNHMAYSNYMSLTYNGSVYGFLSHYQSSSPATTDQAWIDSYYSLESLYKLWSEYGDLELGPENIKISTIFEGVARGYWGLYRTAQGGVVWDDDWANQVILEYTGANRGGTITSVTSTTSPANMYDDSKGNTATTMVRAGAIASNSTLTSDGQDGYSWFTTRQSFYNLGDRPMGKVSALSLTRLADGLSYFDGVVEPPSRLSIE